MSCWLGGEWLGVDAGECWQFGEWHFGEKFANTLTQKYADNAQVLGMYNSSHTHMYIYVY